MGACSVKSFTLLLIVLLSCTLKCSVVNCDDKDMDKSIVEDNFDDYPTSSEHSTRSPLLKHQKDLERRRRKGSKWSLGNFIMTDSLPDKEKEIRIHLKKLYAKQTSAVHNGRGLILRQVSDGRRLTQTILSAEGGVLDCEYIQKRSAAKKFIKTFMKEMKKHPVNRWESRSTMKKRHFLCDNKYGRSAGSRCVSKRRKEERMNKWKVLERYDPMIDESHEMKDKSSEEKYMDIKGVESYDGREDELLGPRNVSAWREMEFDDLSNVNIRRIFDISDLPDNITEWLDIKKSKLMCDSIHEKLKRDYRSSSSNLMDGELQNYRRSRRSKESLVIMPGTLWCGVGQLAENYSELGPLSSADVCCRQHDHCSMKIPSFKHSWGIFNVKPFTLMHCACDRRRSRVARSTVLVPGTRWCGKGSSGKRSELGEFGQADRCCRMHDTACPFWIQAMEMKYGLFNWRPNTLMHCRCDERFRACLKVANTDISNMVGRLFFNVVQTKCFVLKPVKVCTEYSWWGKCLKMGYMKQAHLRDNLSY